MIKAKTIINPFSNELQLISDPNTIAEKNHIHSIQEISGLITILNSLTINSTISVQGGYFAE
jgi:hypothetical protein